MKYSKYLWSWLRSSYVMCGTKNEHEWKGTIDVYVGTPNTQSFVKILGGPCNSSVISGHAMTHTWEWVVKQATDNRNIAFDLSPFTLVCGLLRVLWLENAILLEVC